MLQEIIAQGYFISATPALAYSPPHQAAVQAAPVNRILMETDSPVTYQGVSCRARHPARHRPGTEPPQRAWNLSEAIATTTANARDFFNI